MQIQNDSPTPTIRELGLGLARGLRFDIACDIITVMRCLVLDTNVVVAALRSKEGASRQVLLAALARRFELALSVPLVLEYEAVLNRPEHLLASGLTARDIERVLDDLVAIATPIKLAFRWRPRLRDPKDDMVLETAVNGHAHAIVTFNSRDFAVATPTFGCAVLSPLEVLLQIRRGL
jgi:putative PIN family toxin of toxin-antitoxin system